MSYILSVPSALIALPAESGDEVIKSKLDTIVKTDYQSLDKIIAELSKTFSVEQIYKVYYKTFAF